jgi:hypothetical protein
VWLCSAQLVIIIVRQLTIFGMICRIQENSAHKVAINVPNSKTPQTKSWFYHIQELCQQYCLPEALYQLQSPHPKDSFKKRIKKLPTVNNFSELKHLILAILLSSSSTLNSCHSCGASPSKIAMATVQASSCHISIEKGSH